MTTTPPGSNPARTPQTADCPRPARDRSSSDRPRSTADRRVPETWRDGADQLGGQPRNDTIAVACLRRMNDEGRAGAGSKSRGERQVEAVAQWRETHG